MATRIKLACIRAPAARDRRAPRTRPSIRGFVLGLLASLPLLLNPVSHTAAQEEEGTADRPWQIALWLKGGYQTSAGYLANNAPSDVPDLRLLETVAEMGSATRLGGGLEIRFPDHDFTARVGWETLRGAEVSGRIAACQLFEGDLCEPRVAPVEVWNLSSVFRMVSGNPDNLFRPVILAGGGLRGFTYTVPACPDPSVGDLYRVCTAILDLFEDPKPHPFLQVGAGLQTALNRLVFELGAYAQTARYQGGTARTDGNWYHDLRVEFSTSARIF